MGENETKLNSGQLYFAEPDGTYSLVGHMTEASVECSAEDNDISVPVASIISCEVAFDMLAKEYKEIMLAITGLYKAVINCCPDRRVAHLALHSKKARTRKKNRNRAFRILEENDIL